MVTNENGKLTWTYTLDLYRNRVMLVTTLKAMACICVGVAVILGAALWGSPALQSIGLLGFLGYSLLATLGFLALATGIYYLSAAARHGRRTISFEMDENGVTYQPAKRTTDAPGARGVLADIVEIAVSNPTTAAIDADAPVHIDFAKVRTVKADPQHDSVLVRTRVLWHRVYAMKDDFDRVLSFIRAHAPQAR